MKTIGLVANIYNEVNALPGWLETHTPFFDDIRVYHTGPGGAVSNDGTMEILEKWNIPVEIGSIDEGFGIVRTKAIQSSPCDWVMLLDVDERFFPLMRVLKCSGESTPQNEVDSILQTYDFHDLKTVIPNWENLKRLGAKLNVEAECVYNQGKYLRELINRCFDVDAVCTIRRHWHDFSFKRPTQNWYTDPDWQMRLVRNSPDIRFDSNTRMHEHLLVSPNKIVRSEMEWGPFFDHFHFTFKRMEVEQRAHDVDTYNRIHRGDQPLTWEDFKKEHLK